MSGSAIVTGAAGGIGAAAAERLARDGFPVAVVDVDEEGCVRTAGAIAAVGGTASAIAADVTDEDAIGEAVARAAAELGPPTVLVNNAGFARPAPVEAMATEDWDAVLGVNLRGPFFATRAVVPHMVAAEWGRIVNTASVSALGDPGRSNYGAAKAGLIGFTKSLALELAPHGITVNAVAPGFVESDMTRLSARRAGRDYEEFKRSAAEDIPVGRVGRPEDIAHAIAFFVGREAGFVSGQVLYAAGGPVG